MTAGKTDNAAMQRMYYAVDEERRKEEDVVREFLVKQGLGR